MSVKESTILKTVFISLVIDLLGFTVILPLFPSLLEFYETNDKTYLYNSMKTTVKEFRNLVGVPDSEKIDSVLFGGMIGSLFSLLQFLNSPIFGALSDVYGRKAMIVTSLMGSTVSCAIWAISDSFALFLVARVVAGLSEANVSISCAVIADLPSPKARTQGMAVIGVAFSVGFIFGPMIGAYFTYLFAGEKNFFFGPAIFSLLITSLDVLYVLCFHVETLPVEKRAKSVINSLSDFLHLLNPISLFRFSPIKSLPTSEAVRLRRLGLIYFIYLFLFSGLEFTLSFLAHNRFSFTRMEQGRMFAMLGVTMAFVQGGYVRRNMFGNEKKLAVTGLCMLIPGFLLIGLSNHWTVFYFGLLLFGYAAASVVPCMTSLVSNYGLESEKGRVMGVFRSLGALARATGPVCMSSCYWLMGARSTYVVGGLLLLLPLTLLIRLELKHKAK